MAIQFVKPDTLEEALEVLAKYRAKAVILNGGTDLTEKIKTKEINPEVIVYIQGIAELQGIRQDEIFLTIGGAETYTHVEKHPACQRFPALIQAIAEIASPPIKNAGTPAGNIGSAMPAADCNVALIALNASVILCKQNGERKLPLAEIFEGPGKTCLDPGEIIKEIKIPWPKANEYSSFVKLARRKAQDIAQVSVGVNLTLNAGICEDVRIVLGAVNPVPVRALSLENRLRGKSVLEGLAQIKNVFPPEANPRADRFLDYKFMVTNTIIARAVQKAYQAGVGGEHNGQATSVYLK